MSGVFGDYLGLMFDEQRRPKSEMACSKGPAQVASQRADEALSVFAGTSIGVYEPHELDELRDEWERRPQT